MRLPRPRWPQLSDSQVTTLVLAVGVSICIVVAALRFGLVVALLTLNAVVAGLILERTKLFRLVNEARADAEDDVDHLRDRHDRELADIRGWLDAFRDWAEQAEPDVDDLAWSEPTQPIEMPAPNGPATQPADVVLIGKWAEPTRQEHRGPEPWEWAKGPAARANAQDIEEQIQAIRERSAQRQAAKVAAVMEESA